MPKNMQELVNFMISRGVLKTPSFINAFLKIDRKFFVPIEFKDNTYEDVPLPIGKSQTISQPSTVAFMLELLSPRRGDKVLDIGSGSGWSTALLCKIVGKNGSVTGIERIDELVKQGKKNLEKFDFGKECTIKKAGKNIGMRGVKFDKILVSASAKEFPNKLQKQLNINGKLVIPVQNSIFEFKKISDKTVESKEFPGFVFVPLVYDEKSI